MYTWALRFVLGYLNVFTKFSKIGTFVYRNRNLIDKNDR